LQAEQSPISLTSGFPQILHFLRSGFARFKNRFMHEEQKGTTKTFFPHETHFSPPDKTERKYFRTKTRQNMTRKTLLVKFGTKEKTFIAYIYEIKIKNGQENCKKIKKKLKFIRKSKNS